MKGPILKPCLKKKKTKHVYNLSSYSCLLSHYSAFPVALLFPLFITCGKRTFLCNVTSGYFNETVWNLLLLIMSKYKQWNLGRAEISGIFLLTSIEPELHAEIKTDPLDLSTTWIYIWVRVHWLCCRSKIVKPAFIIVLRGFIFYPPEITSTQDNGSFSRKVVSRSFVVWFP